MTVYIFCHLCSMKHNKLSFHFANLCCITMNKWLCYLVSDLYLSHSWVTTLIVKSYHKYWWASAITGLTGLLITNQAVAPHVHFCSTRGDIETIPSYLADRCSLRNSWQASRNRISIQYINTNMRFMIKWKPVMMLGLQLDNCHL